MASITATALPYKGRWTYVFGGTPDPPRVLVGDCSSFVTTVLSEADPGIVLPGGGRWGDPDYPPHSHGPDVAEYIGWDGAETVTTPAPGDLVCWGPNGHIGIALGNGEMISALNPGLGVRQTPILGNGPGGTAPTEYRRVLGVLGGPGATAPGVASQPSLLDRLTSSLAGSAFGSFLGSFLGPLGNALGDVLGTAAQNVDPRKLVKAAITYAVVPALLPFVFIAAGVLVVGLAYMTVNALTVLAAGWAARRVASAVTERAGSRA